MKLYSITEIYIKICHIIILNLKYKINMYLMSLNYLKLKEGGGGGSGL